MDKHIRRKVREKILNMHEVIERLRAKALREEQERVLTIEQVRESQRQRRKKWDQMIRRSVHLGQQRDILKREKEQDRLREERKKKKVEK